MALLTVSAVFASCAGLPPSPREPVPPLEKLEGWLNQRESQVPGLRPGTAAGVVWSDPSQPAITPYALVYLPGYTATRGELSPVPERLAASLGANAYFSRPSGQGSTADAHAAVRVGDWVADAREALAIGAVLGKRVIVMGTSTGATSAILEVLEAGARPAAVILVSPNLTMRNRGTELAAWPGGGWLVEWFGGRYRTLTIENAEHERIWDIRSNTRSLVPLMQLVAHTRALDFTKWPVPALVVYNRGDTTVDTGVTLKLFAKAPRSMVTLTEWHAAKGENNHVLAGAALSPSGTEPMIELCLEYLRTVLD